MKNSLQYSIFSLLVLCSIAASQPRKQWDGKNLPSTSAVYPLNEGWRYLEDPVRNVQELSKSGVSWKEVTIPHSWNAFDAVDEVPGYRRSAGWYKRELSIPADIGERRVLLYFEGINITSEVYVNGKRAGGHVGGYVGFEVDATPFIAKGSSNEICVRADNSYNIDIIPSQKSDFFIYGGMCRNVWFKLVPPVSIDRVLVKTRNVSKASAETECEILLRRGKDTPKDIAVEVRLLDRSGKVAAQAEASFAGSKSPDRVLVPLPLLTNPILWSPADPALYDVVVALKKSGKVVDQVRERTGYRWYEFRDHGPFYLNGERLLLRGTHRHEDYAGMANAMPDSLHRKDMKMIKEMGANFVRLAHYPQAPEVYRACDELGLLVWDELPWCRGGAGGPAWKENTKRLLREQILQNMNHPSIIIWSLGNEAPWVPDVPGGDDRDTLRSVFGELNTIAHTLDPTRLTAVRKIEEVADIVDVFSPSIWAGWYSSVYSNYEKIITSSRDKFKRLLHVEYGGDSHVGRHTETPIDGNGIISVEGQQSKGDQRVVKNIAQNGDWSESYIVDLFDWHLRTSEQLDWLSGNAQWAFKDFGTPLRPENPIPYVNQKGLVDRAGNPKDAYYVFKSYWTTNPKFCYIESHTWTERSGQEKAPRGLNVFSNCDSVEVVLNGASQGIRVRNIKNFPASGLSWNVVFREGENDIAAMGYAGGKIATEDRMKLKYSYGKSGEPVGIDLASEQLPNGNRLITATAVDAKGRRCLDYNKRITFVSLEQGQLLVNRGTPNGSSIIEMANGKAQVEFKPAKTGRNVVEAINQDFKGTYLIVR